MKATRLAPKTLGKAIPKFNPKPTGRKECDGQMQSTSTMPIKQKKQLAGVTL